MQSGFLPRFSLQKLANPYCKKLVDFDRHNNSLTKLRDKKEKTLNDEKNLFKVDPDHSCSTYN